MSKLAWSLIAASSLASGQTGGVLFETKIRPLLAERCHACHTKTAASGLRVDSREALLRGGSRGPAIIPGDPARGTLLSALKHAGALKMPPQARLAESEIAAVEQWIRAGAAWPKAPAPTTESGEFWSFRDLRDPGGSIDSLVRKALAAKGVAPNPRADERTLLRRLSFDLTGLPPGEPAGSYEQTVDRLLASPRFGERWGRHWLDVARFGEEDFSGTAPKFYSNAWRYRDWVIAAFNADMPYDRFVRAQIAADLMDERDRPALTGGLGLFGFGPWYYGISQPPQARADERHDRVDMTGRGFLGLTIACARCHDHKYDPVSMQDYYALAGVFASSKYEEYPLAPDAEVRAYKEARAAVKAQETRIAKFLDAQRDQLAGVLAHRIAEAMLGGESVDAEFRERISKYLSKPEEDFPFLDAWRAAVARKAPRAELERLAGDFQRLVIEVADEKAKLDAANQALRDAAKPARTNRRKIILPGGYDSDADFNPGADVPVAALARDRMLLWRRFYLGKDALLRFEEDKIERFLTGPWKDHLASMRAELARITKSSPPEYGFHQGIAEHEEPVDLPLAVRGNPYEDGPPVPRRFLAALSKTEHRWTNGSGRRELAEAIAASPLAARVMANRVWMHLFGAGIVSTPSNFGRAGDRPSNPDLLEHLAWRFRAHGYSIKLLVREIVLSDTYRASAAANPANERIDAGNRLFWRANRRRLDAEALHDAVLAVTGGLDERLGGESAVLDEKFARRAVYARISRFKQEETLALFDFPSASVSAEQRASTNVPLQKLYFLNSPFLLLRSEALGRRIEQQGVGHAYRLLFGRSPDEAERRLAREYLAAGGPGAHARYAQALLGSNEFAFID